MANYWRSSVWIENKTPAKRKQILTHLCEEVGTEFLDEAAVYNTKGYWHDIEGELTQFSTQYPDAIFSLSSDGDMHCSESYPESQELFEQHYKDIYIQNGAQLKRKKVLFSKVLALLPVAELRDLAKSWEIKNTDGKKEDLVHLLTLHCWRNKWHTYQISSFWNAFSKTQLIAFANTYKVDSKGTKDTLITQLKMALDMCCDDNHDMEWYANLNGDSGVIGYKMVRKGIQVQFEDGKIYFYSNTKPGRSTVTAMKEHAESGAGLNTYINQHVRANYEERLI